jgi:DNA-binding IclR family transcriptional regulator
VGAVTNAVAILRSVIGQPVPLGVNALARVAGISPSSCFNILKTLVGEGLIDFDPVTKTYSPGSGLYALAPQGADGQGIFAKCAPLCDRFAEKHSATVALWRVTPSERLLLVGFADSPLMTRIHMTVGQRMPMLAGAGGRCVAGALQLSPAAIAQRFQQLRWDNPPSLEDYVRQVGEARERGWALDDGAYLAGVTTVSVPILDREGRPAFALGATLFRGQRSEPELARIGEALKALGSQVAAALAL